MRVIPCAAAAAAMLTFPIAAFAHAELVRATPAPGSTVHPAPATVDILFSEELEPKFSAITVTDAAGTRVDKKDVHLASDSPEHLTVSLGQLAPGVYTVSWHATATDTHKTHGSFRFTVAR